MPNTDAYLVMGLVVVAVVLGGYAVGLAVRMASARKDLTLLARLKDE